MRDLCGAKAKFTLVYSRDVSVNHYSGTRQVAGKCLASIFSFGCPMLDLAALGVTSKGATHSYAA